MSGRIVRIVVLGLALAGLVAGCAAEPSAPSDGHAVVSVPPDSTATATPETPVSPQGVLATTIDPAGFGMHVNQVAAGAWPDIPLGSFRIFNSDTSWGSLEPSPGQWTFSRLDQRVANAEAHGGKIMLVLTHPPTWASSRPDLEAYGGSPAPPSNLDAWKTYVRTVVTRYAGRIEAYEIWNEPNLSQFYAGTPETLATLTELAAAEIRAADPAALVVSAGFSARTGGSQPFFEAFTGALDPAAIDVVGIHIYPYPGDGPESMLTMVSQFRDLAAAAGLGDKPMWNTEIGYGRTPNAVFSGDTAASLVLRTYLVLPAAGLPRNYWYMWDDRKFVGLYLVGSDRRTPSPAARALEQAEELLAGASVAGCEDTGGGTWVCELQRGALPFTVVWSLSGETTYTVPEGMTMQTPFTGDSSPVAAGTAITVGTLPVILSSVPVSELER